MTENDIATTSSDPANRVLLVRVYAVLDEIPAPERVGWLLHHVEGETGHKVLWLTFSSNRDYGLHLVNHGFDSCYPPESPNYDTPQPLSKQGVTYNSCAQPQIWMAAVIVDEDPSLDAKDRSFPAFWLPFQDVNAHNHTAQWVAKIASTPPPDGGTPADGGACYATGTTCGTGSGGVCCSDLVCCNGSCQADCNIIP